MSSQRLRRWSNIVQMLYKCFVFAVVFHALSSGVSREESVFFSETKLPNIDLNCLNHPFDYNSMLSSLSDSIINDISVYTEIRRPRPTTPSVCSPTACFFTKEEHILLSKHMYIFTEPSESLMLNAIYIVNINFTTFNTHCT